MGIIYPLVLLTLFVTLNSSIKVNLETQSTALLGSYSLNKIESESSSTSELEKKKTNWGPLKYWCAKLSTFVLKQNKCNKPKKHKPQTIVIPPRPTSTPKPTPSADDCKSGTYFDDDKDRCLSCDAGSYSLDQAEDCTLCPVGSYQDEEGKSSCIECESVEETGATFGRGCDDDSYSVSKHKSKKSRKHKKSKK